MIMEPLKRFEYSTSARGLPRNALLSFLLPPSASCLLHMLIPGGMVLSHKTVINILSTLLCLCHVLSLKKAKFHSCYIILLSISAFFVVGILFGAHPLKLWDNISWSYLMASLIIAPSIGSIGVDFKSWIRVFLQSRFNSALENYYYVVSLATLMGVWLGAFPILLDWNRPWQVWPIPCSMGALIGNATGHILGMIINTATTK